MELPAIEKLQEDNAATPFRTLVSTMLSAQTRDPVTYEASMRLFARADSPAALAALQAVEAGAQVAVMAPTELLAEQHYRNFHAWLSPLGIEVAWLSGVNGAKFGLLVPGAPRVGDRYYQESAPKVAMDRAEVLSVGAEVKVPAGVFKNCLHTKESSALESGSEDKFYAPGVGLIKDADFALVKIEKGPFEGYEGIVDERIPGKERVRVLLNFLQNRKLAVELPADHVNAKRKPAPR